MPSPNSSPFQTHPPTQNTQQPLLNSKSSFLGSSSSRKPKSRGSLLTPQCTKYQIPKTTREQDYSPQSPTRLQLQVKKEQKTLKNIRLINKINKDNAMDLDDHPLLPSGDESDQQSIEIDEKDLLEWQLEEVEPLRLSQQHNIQNHKLQTLPLNQHFEIQPYVSSGSPPLQHQNMPIDLDQDLQHHIIENVSFKANRFANLKMFMRKGVVEEQLVEKKDSAIEMEIVQTQINRLNSSVQKQIKQIQDPLQQLEQPEIDPSPSMDPLAALFFNPIQEQIIRKPLKESKQIQPIKEISEIEHQIQQRQSQQIQIRVKEPSQRQIPIKQSQQQPIIHPFNRNNEEFVEIISNEDEPERKQKKRGRISNREKIQKIEEEDFEKQMRQCTIVINKRVKNEDIEYLWKLGTVKVWRTLGEAITYNYDHFMRVANKYLSLLDKALGEFEIPKTKKSKEKQKIIKSMPEPFVKHHPEPLMVKHLPENLSSKPADQLPSRPIKHDIKFQIFSKGSYMDQNYNKININREEFKTIFDKVQIKKVSLFERTLKNAVFQEGIQQELRFEEQSEYYPRYDQFEKVLEEFVENKADKPIITRDRQFKHFKDPRKKLHLDQQHLSKRLLSGKSFSKRYNYPVQINNFFLLNDFKKSNQVYISRLRSSEKVEIMDKQTFDRSIIHSKMKNATAKIKSKYINLEDQ